MSRQFPAKRTVKCSASCELRVRYHAYLDIETTGLSCEYAGITVIGVYMVKGADDRLVQLVGMDAGMPPRFTRGGE